MPHPDSLGPEFRSYGTTNIKLGAILLTMGFPLREGMPCEIDLHAQTGVRNKRWWFAHQIQWSWGDCPDAAYEAWRIQNWYDEKESFEAGIGKEHPVTWMRGALDWREWLIKLQYNEVRIKSPGAGGLKTYPTDDWLFAACLLAANYKLLKRDGDMLYFFDDGNCSRQQAQYFRDFDPSDKISRLPITWRREALRSRDFLHRLITSKAVVPMVQTVHKGAHVLLSANASRETKHELFSL